MNIIKKVILLQFICLFIFSCKKEKTIVTNIFSNQEFVNQNWVITESSVKRNTTDPNAIENEDITIEDTFINLPGCVKDDVYQFRSDSTYHVLAGANNCGNLLALTNTATWEITTDGKRLIISFYRISSGSLDYTIEYFLNKADNESFEVYAPIVSSFGDYKKVIVIKFEKE